MSNNKIQSTLYGMTESDIREQYMNSLTAEFCGLEMVVMGILSDVQELSAVGSPNLGVQIKIQQQLNVAKFILAEMKEAKEIA